VSRTITVKATPPAYVPGLDDDTEEYDDAWDADYNDYEPGEFSWAVDCD
jgi:hypothetical protein